MRARPDRSSIGGGEDPPPRLGSRVVTGPQPTSAVTSPLPDGRDPRLHVLWLIKGLGPGGAERLLVAHARAADPDGVRYQVAYLLPWKSHLVPELAAAGVRAHCLSGGREWDLRWAWRLRRLLRDHCIHVLHAHSPYPAAVARVLVRTLPKSSRPVQVFSEHNEWQRYARLSRWANRLTWRLGDAHLAVSEGVRTTLPAAIRSRAEVAVGGIDLAAARQQRVAREEVRAELGVGSDEVLIGTIANLRREKGYSDLLHAARQVIESGLPVKFVSVGQGPLEGALREEHAELELGQGFQFLGYRDDALRLLAGFDLFVLSSHHEGLPVSLMEALALGVPIVSTAVGGIPEAVEDGHEAVLVPPGRPDLLAAAIVDLVPDAARRHSMAEAALAGSERFGATGAVRRLEGIYRELASQRAGEGSRTPGEVRPRFRARRSRARVDPPARVVHVLPADVARGAQVFARALREALDGRPDEHRTVALFAAEGEHLRPDVALGIEGGWGRRLGWDPRAAVALRRALRAMSPDLVVAHGGEALKYAVAARPPAASLVYKKTGSSAASLEDPVRRTVYRWLARRADLTAAVAQETAEEACELLRLPPDRVMLAPNGRDPSVYHPRSSRRNGSPVRLVFVGRLTPSKRPDWFVAVARRLARDGVDVEGTIAGDGPMMDEVLAESDGSGVTVLGRRSDVPEVLAASDVLVFPGVAEGEGMPGVLIEAGLSGLPVVTTAVSGAGTVVDHGATGFVVPIGDFEGLVEGVERLARDPDLRSRMGQAARERCVTHFTMEASASRWQEIFDRVLGRR